MKKKWLGALVALIGFIACVGALAAADVANEMKTLLEQGRSSEAYELGRSNPDQLGEPLFDLYFGVAATNAGRAGEGVLALERYVANMPNDAQGRLELARAYFVLGIDERARQEFMLVLEANPPADSARTSSAFSMRCARARQPTAQPAASRSKAASATTATSTAALRPAPPSASSAPISWSPMRR